MIESASDADCLIVKTALNYAREGQEVILIAEDCDILVLCIHHYDITCMADVKICQFAKSETGEIYSVKQYRSRDHTEHFSFTRMGRM